jgi:hypothetical protein
MVVCKYPIQDRECNGSNERILDITAICKAQQTKEVKDERNKQTDSISHKEVANEFKCTS